MAPGPGAEEFLEATDKRMRVTRVDQVSAMLMTGVLFVGMFTGMLFMLWLWSQMKFPRPEIKVVAIEEKPPGRGENAEGTERDFEPPAADEVEQLLEPTVQDTLTAVTDAVTSVAASLDVVVQGNPNDGKGKGDNRPPGPEGDDDLIPRYERWKLKFISKDVQTYAQQLDFFKIELGVVGGGVPGVDYGSNFAGSSTKRHGESEAEQRLYFRWTDEGVLKQFDRQLLQKAGVQTNNRLMMMFVPKDLENLLATIELDYFTKAGKPNVKHVAKTIFEVQPDGSGYVFKVIDQRYRTPKN